MVITHLCENAHFTYFNLHVSLALATLAYDKCEWDMSQYNKLSDIQYARFQILPVDLHFGLFWSAGIPTMILTNSWFYHNFHKWKTFQLWGGGIWHIFCRYYTVYTPMQEVQGFDTSIDFSQQSVIWAWSINPPLGGGGSVPSLNVEKKRSLDVRGWHEMMDIFLDSQVGNILFSSIISQPRFFLCVSRLRQDNLNRMKTG